MIFSKENDLFLFRERIWRFYILPEISMTIKTRPDRNREEQLTDPIFSKRIDDLCYEFKIRPSGKFIIVQFEHWTDIENHAYISIRINMIWFPCYIFFAKIILSIIKMIFKM